MFILDTKFESYNDEIDYSTLINDAIANNASASEVSDLNNARQEKIVTSGGSLDQYYNDDVYKAANDYIKNMSASSNTETPSYIDSYKDTTNDLVTSYLGKDDFSYDYTTDPTYQQYADVYTKAGQEAMQNTIGEVSARTGGLASSYATTAASQANNAYMSELANIIPSLESQAYSRYTDGKNDSLNEISLLQGLSSDEYNKYLNELSQYNSDRSFNYGVERDNYSDNLTAEQIAYSMAQDTLAQDSYNKEWDYNVSQNDLAQQNYLDSVAYQKSRDAVSDSQWQQSFDLQKASAYSDSSGSYTDTLPAGISYNEALEMAQDIADLSFGNSDVLSQDDITYRTNYITELADKLYSQSNASYSSSGSSTGTNNSFNADYQNNISDNYYNTQVFDGLYGNTPLTLPQNYSASNGDQAFSVLDSWLQDADGTTFEDRVTQAIKSGDMTEEQVRKWFNME